MAANCILLFSLPGPEKHSCRLAEGSRAGEAGTRRPFGNSQHLSHAARWKCTLNTFENPGKKISKTYSQIWKHTMRTSNTDKHEEKCIYCLDSCIGKTRTRAWCHCHHKYTEHTEHHCSPNPVNHNEKKKKIQEGPNIHLNQHSQQDGISLLRFCFCFTTEMPLAKSLPKRMPTQSCMKKSDECKHSHLRKQVLNLRALSSKTVCSLNLPSHIFWNILPLSWKSPHLLSLQESTFNMRSNSYRLLHNQYFQLDF